jgi:cytochrome c553
MVKLRMLPPLVRSLAPHFKPAPKRAEPFYVSPEWRAFRAEIEKQRGRRCEDPECKAPHAPGPRYLDHVKERKDGGADFDPGNVLFRCATCHGRKTEEARQARARDAFA